MKYEVEQKHRVDDVPALMSLLEGRGVRLNSAVEQYDQYYSHPVRDFATTDEALRIRITDGKPLITYKGPKLDSATKTRRELELPLPHELGGQFGQSLETLGFSPVATVRKSRRTFQLQYEGHEIEGAIDGVGQLGTFVELELLADDAALAEAQRVISSLASELNLGPTERRSYLEMLLENR